MGRGDEGRVWGRGESLGTRGEPGDEGRAWGRGESLGTRGEPGDEGRAWGRGESLGTRGEPGGEGRAWGRGESLGTRGEPGDEGRVWGRGESLGTYNCEGLTLHCICGVCNFISYNNLLITCRRLLTPFCAGLEMELRKNTQVFGNI